MEHHTVGAAAREAVVDAGESPVEPRRLRRARRRYAPGPACADGTLDGPAVGAPQVADADETQP